MVELSMNSDKKYWAEERAKNKQLTFMYVPQDDPDYIHIVILNYNAKTLIDKHAVQQYKIKDWTGILKKSDRATYCCGLTAQNVLVILDKDIVHYISLTEALRESGMVEETRKCVPGEFPEIPLGEKMLKSKFIFKLTLPLHRY